MPLVIGTAAVENGSMSAESSKDVGLPVIERELDTHPRCLDIDLTTTLIFLDSETSSSSDRMISSTSSSSSLSFPSRGALALQVGQERMSHKLSGISGPNTLEGKCVPWVRIFAFLTGPRG